jgi:hypothetical protein
MVNYFDSGNRRDFLKRGGLLSAAAAAASAKTVQELPQMRLGKYSISRLVCGSNMFGAGSHSSIFLNKRLKEYYTPERILNTLRRCGEVGLNTWQTSGAMAALNLKLAEQGTKMNCMVIAAAHETAAYGGQPIGIDDYVKAGCIGIAHHGEYTDQLFKSGKLDEVNEYLKRVRDAGLLVGVSTHMPAVVDTIESKGWDVDYYMTCLYERHRSAEELKKLMGYVPLPVGEVYLREDPERMFRMIRQTKRTCFAFKILAAGRVSDKPESTEAAFRNAFAAIKPGDGVIVGMYDEYSDQPLENAGYARKYGARPA